MDCDIAIVKLIPDVLQGSVQGLTQSLLSNNTDHEIRERIFGEKEFPVRALRDKHGKHLHGRGRQAGRRGTTLLDAPAKLISLAARNSLVVSRSPTLSAAGREVLHETAQVAGLSYTAAEVRRRRLKALCKRHER